MLPQSKLLGVRHPPEYTQSDLGDELGPEEDRHLLPLGCQILRQTSPSVDREIHRPNDPAPLQVREAYVPTDWLCCAVRRTSGADLHTQRHLYPDFLPLALPTLHESIYR